MSSPPSRYRRVSNTVEWSLIALIRLGQVSLGVSVTLFCGYVLYGFSAGQLAISRPLRSLGQSVPANVLFGLSGFSLCLLNGALILHTVYQGIEDVQEGMVLIFAFAGFGFGAGLLNLTWPVITSALSG